MTKDPKRTYIYTYKNRDKSGRRKEKGEDDGL